MTQWIAEEKVVFVHPDGKRVVGRIAVAAPIVREQDCACEVVLEGLERSYTIFGDTTLQALLLGVGCGCMTNARAACGSNSMAERIRRTPTIRMPMQTRT